MPGRLKANCQLHVLHDARQASNAAVIGGTGIILVGLVSGILDHPVAVQAAGENIKQSGGLLAGQAAAVAQHTVTQNFISCQE